MERSDDIKQSQYISREKAADIEFSYVAGEMRARTEFNRRVQNIQITLLSSLFVAPLIAFFTASNPAKIDATLFGDVAALVSFAILGIMTVNFVVLLEIEQNEIYVLMTAGYFDIILTRKYLLGPALPAFEYAFWVNLLSRLSRSRLERNVFLLSAHIFLSIIILGISSIIFVGHQFLATMIPVYRIAGGVYFVGILCLYGYAFRRQFQSVQRLKAFITPDEIKAFQDRYPVIAERIDATK